MKNIYIVGTDAGIITCLESLIASTDNFKVLGRSLKASSFLMELKNNAGLLEKTDLLLIDPKLPDTNGLELITKVQSKKKNINIGILLNENLKRFFSNDISNYGIDESNVIIYPGNDDIYYLNKLNSIFEKIEDNKISDEFTNKFIPNVKKETSEVNDEESENVLTNIGITNNYLDLFDFENINEEELNKLAKMHGWTLPNEHTSKIESDEYSSEPSETVNFEEPENMLYENNDNEYEQNEEIINENLDIGFENNISEKENAVMNDIDEDSSILKKRSLDDIIGNIDEYNVEDTNQDTEYIENNNEIDDFEVPSLNRKDTLDKTPENKVEVEFNDETSGTYDYADFLENFNGIPKVSNSDNATPAPIDFGESENIEDNYSESSYSQDNFEDSREKVDTPLLNNNAEDIVPQFDFGEESRNFIENDYGDKSECNVNGFVNNPQKSYKDLPKFSKQIVAFYSSKGGIGKTSTIVNTAIMLSKYSNKRICIVDLDLPDPNVHIHLGIRDNKYDLADVADTEGLIDSLSIKKCITKFEKEDDKGLIAKFDVLVGFKSKRYLIQRFNEREIDRLLSILEDMYDIVLVDTNPEYSNIAVSTVLKKCTKLIFITQQDLSAIGGARDFLLMMKECKMPLQKIFFILNKYSPIGGISQSQIEDTLGKKVVAAITKDDESMLTSINTREPITISKSESVISESYKEIAKIVDTTISLDTKNKKDRGIFKKFLKR